MRLHPAPLNRFSVPGLLAAGLLALTGLPGWCQQQDPKKAEQPQPGDSGAGALKHRFDLEQLTLLQRQLLDVQAELRRQQAEVTVLAAKEKAVSDAKVPDAAVDEAIEQDPVTAGYQRRMADVDARISVMRQITQPANFDRESLPLRQQLRELRLALEAYRKESRPLVIEQLRARARSEVQAEISRLQERSAVSRELEKMLDAEVQRLREKVGAVPKPDDATAERLERLEKEVRQLKTLIEELKELVKKQK